MKSKLRSGKHCVFSLQAHLVFTTKYRKSVFTNWTLSFLQKYLEKVCKDFDADLLEFNGEKNHVHLLISYSPKISLSRLINSLKGTSSRLLRSNFPTLKKYLYKGHLWSPSYYASSCGGVTLDILKEYIDNQSRPV